jgi:hypothetical protein
MNAYNGPPMTLGSAAAAGVRLIVWFGMFAVSTLT